MDKFKESLLTKNEFFENKIKPILSYVGTIGTVITSIAYIILVVVLIFGFHAQSLTQTVVFAVVNGIAGTIIMQFLKVQGISFAKEILYNQSLLEEYYRTKTKDKKARPIKYFWLTSVPRDILLKAISIMVFTGSVIYIVIAGSQNYVLLALAVVNLLMFFCFGLLSLTAAYDFFNESHIPYIKERLEEYYSEQKAIEESNKEAEQLKLIIGDEIDNDNL